MKTLALNVDAIRREFPSLDLELAGRPAVFLDGPGGTQVPRRVIDAVTDYYLTANANEGGSFATSVRSDEIVAHARAAVADFYGARSPAEIKFGYNMTTLTFHVSRSIAAACQPGDEILVTALDHEANVSPWLAAAADHGLTVKTVDFRPDDCTLDLSDLERKLSSRTRLVAAGYASNAVGTLNPISQIAGMAHDVGAWLYVDAVHYAPHLTLDVAASGADFLVTSAYKWFGPHIGALWGRTELLESLPKYKVRPAHDDFETGTPALELIAGAGAAVSYLESIGRLYGGEARARYDAADRPAGSTESYPRTRARPAAQAGGGSAGTARRPSVGHHGRGALRRRASSYGIDHVCKDRRRRRRQPSGTARDLRLARGLLRAQPDRATRPGRLWRAATSGHRALQHGC